MWNACISPTIAVDLDGNGGQAYRIYQATFDRQPDAAELGFWIGQMDKGATLAAEAAGFMQSEKFFAMYGAAPSNADLVSMFYQNVLHRAGEAGGLAFWTKVLDEHAVTPTPTNPRNDNAHLHVGVA